MIVSNYQFMFRSKNSSEDSTLADNLKLAAKCMIKMGDAATATPERYETTTVQMVDGKIEIKSIPKDELQKLLDEAKKEAEKDKAQATKFETKLDSSHRYF